MCFAERNTDSRGRSVVPLTFLRIDAFRRRRLSSLLLAMIVASSLRGAGLADLAVNHFLEILDALALVGLGRADVADLRRGLAELLAIDPAQDHHVLVHLGRDALGQL